MRLEDGKLYETKRGWRFRVFETSPGVFTCSSFSGSWDFSGRAYGKVARYGEFKKPHLVVEVFKTVLVSVSREQKADVCKGAHHFKRISKEEAQRLGHESNILGESRKEAAILARVVAANWPVDCATTEAQQRAALHQSKVAMWKARRDREASSPQKIGRPASLRDSEYRWVSVAQLKRWRNAMVEGQADYMAAYREIIKVLEEPAESIG